MVEKDKASCWAGFGLISGQINPPRPALTPAPSPGNARVAVAARSKPQVQATEQSGALRLSWDASTHRYLTVSHVGGGAKRTTLAQDLDGGSASLPLEGLPAGGHLEFSLSDGLNSVRVTHSR